MASLREELPKLIKLMEAKHEPDDPVVKMLRQQLECLPPKGQPQSAAHHFMQGPHPGRK